MASKLKIGDLIWGKMKGFPAWPGKIIEPKPEIKKPKKDKFQHFVFFFGSENYAWLPVDSVFPFTQNKEKFIIKTRIPRGFKEAVEAVEDALKAMPEEELKPEDLPSIDEEIAQIFSDPESGNVNDTSIDSRGDNEDSSSKEKTPVSEKPKKKKRPRESDGGNESPKKTPKILRTRKSEGNSTGKKVKPAKNLTPSEKILKKAKATASSSPAANIFSAFSPKRSFSPGSPGKAKQRKLPELRVSESDLAYSPSFGAPGAPISALSGTQLEDAAEAKSQVKAVIPTPMRIGFLGLGIMGQGMVMNLLRSGHEVTVWNRTTQKSLLGRRPCSKFKIHRYFGLKMARRRRKCHCSPRNCLLSAVLMISILTVLYELVIFCELDRLSQPDGGRQALQRSVASKTRTVTQIHADKVLHELSGFRQSNIDELGPSQILNTIHYVWCTNASFEFRNYLSVMSAWKIIQPDIIEFHEQEAAQTDKYNDWLDRIQKTIPNFVRKPMPKFWDGDDKGCGFWFGLAVLDDRGGIYIGSNVIVTENFVQNKNSNLTILLHLKTSQDPYQVAAALAKDHAKKFRSFRRDFDGKHDIDHDIANRQCTTYTKGSNITGNECIVFEDDLHPVDLFEDSSETGGFLRKLHYGTSHLISEAPALPGFIPKIVYYVWFGSKEMSFMMYLSMLSTLFILSPQHVYIHTDGGLHGDYFSKIKRDDRVVVVYREKPFHIFGHDILYSQHRSDIVRAECLLKYGGIYMDWDVLWLRDPGDVISQGHDAVANFDHMAQTGYPDTINLGVLMAKPKSTFIKRWQDALINYRSKDFLYNAVLLPYKVYEDFPQYLHIERRLQVMCFHLKCHPTFHPGYKSFMEEQDFDWTKDVYSIHYTYPDPPELNSYEAMMNGSGRAADIGRFIHKHSAKLD